MRKILQSFMHSCLWREMWATCQFHSPASSPSQIYTTGPCCIEDWVGSSAYLDIASNRQFSAPARNCNPVDGPVRHSTDYATWLVTVQCHFRPKYFREHPGHQQAHVKMRNCCFSTSMSQVFIFNQIPTPLKTASPCSVLSPRRNALLFSVTQQSPPCFRSITSLYIALLVNYYFSSSTSSLFVFFNGVW